MKMPHLTNGQKATFVASLGAVSLAGVIALAIVDLTIGHGQTQSALMASAFTFLCTNVTAAMSYLMGASAPDQQLPAPLALPAPAATLPAPAETTIDDQATIVTDGR